MSPRNIEIEMGLQAAHLKHKRYLDAPGGTSLEQFDFDLRSAVHKALLDKAPYGKALTENDKQATITIGTQRPFRMRHAKMEFTFSLNTETKALALREMKMEMDTNKDYPLVWKVEEGKKMPDADTAHYQITGFKHQAYKPANGRQIKGGHQDNHKKR